MKKLFIAVLAVAGLAACAQDEILSTPKGAAIDYAAFVQNSTRANDITASNLADFGVYGSVTNTNGSEALIFNNQEVSGDCTNGYTYSPLQYWVADNTYEFVAVAPYSSAHWSYANATNDAYNGTITFDNAAARADQDLLFASQIRKTDASITAAPQKVGFTFNHMLARVKFTFTNGWKTGGNTHLVVKNVKITDAYSMGDLAISNGVAADVWTLDEANKNLQVAFGNADNDDSADSEVQIAENAYASTEHFYLIPADAKYNITFTIDYYQAGVLVDSYDRVATVEWNMTRGNSYDLKATLNAANTSDEGQIFPIEFNVDAVEDWVDKGDYQGGNYAANMVAVSTYEELVEAVKLDEVSITLLNDITVENTLAIAKDKVVYLNLNGKTVSQEKTQSAAYNMIQNMGTLTIYNEGTISYADTATLTASINYVSNPIQNSGVLTIEEGVTIVNNSSASVAKYGYPHAIDNSGVLTINGGTFTNNTNYSSVRIWCTTDDDTIVTINGGTFNGCIDLHNVSANANKGTLIINGGTFNADTYTNCATRLLGFGTDVDEIKGLIHGGTFNGNVKLNNYAGGEFNSNVYVIDGGTFSVEPNASFLADGYKVEENNGLYTVVAE